MFTHTSTNNLITLSLMTYFMGMAKEPPETWPIMLDIVITQKYQWSLSRRPYHLNGQGKHLIGETKEHTS